MIVQIHNPVVSSELADALTADHNPAIAPHPVWTERSAIALGGPWPLTGWKRHLRETIAADHPMTALTVRTAPDERRLASPVWSNIAYGLVNASDWTTTPWLAVRTTTQSMVILATTGRRPSASTIWRAADVIQRANDLIPPGAANQSPPAPVTSAFPPMRLVRSATPTPDREPPSAPGGGRHR